MNEIEGKPDFFFLKKVSLRTPRFPFLQEEIYLGTTHHSTAPGQHSGNSNTIDCPPPLHPADVGVVSTVSGMYLEFETIRIFLAWFPSAR